MNGKAASLFCSACLSGSLFSQISWDGEAADGLWISDANWSSDAAPGGGDVITIDNGDTVNLAGLVNGNLPNGVTVTVDGGSTLAQSSGAARMAGATINIGSTGSLTGPFWDLSNGTVNFEDGAVVTTGSWEHKGTNVFGYTLDSDGFATLSPGHLRSSGGVAWSDVTYHIDFSTYVLSNGTTVVLADYSAHDAAFDGTFDPTVNMTAGASGLSATLEFDTVGSRLLLVFESLPITWDNAAGDGLWTTAANWNPDGVPGSDADILVGAGATVTEAPDSFGSLEIESGASVTMAGEFLSGSKTLDVAGSLNRQGVLRFGATMDLSGSLGADISFLDTGNGTIRFVDGASFGNSNMPFEHKGSNTFGYKLSETGFTTMVAGSLFAGAGAVWSDVTYEIDVSDYNPANGLTIVLADYSSHAAAFDGTFDPVVNMIAGSSGLGGALTFDTLTSQLVLTINPPGNDAPVAENLTIAVEGTSAVPVTLVATDIEGQQLSYSVLAQPSHGALSGDAPGLTYTPSGAAFTTDTFTYTASDGTDTSNPATVTLISIPDTAEDFWASVNTAILNDALNVQSLTSWVDGGVTISQIRYDLGILTGTQVTASPKIAAYYAVPTGGTNLPGLVQIHGGGQRASATLAKYWAEQGYAAISINWGGLPLEAGQDNTDWDGLAAGFTRDGVTEALHHNFTDPDSYTDGATLHNIPHPLNSSWLLNSYAARRALTLLQAQPEVDGTKLGVLGWSMGGRTTVLTATDSRITCVGPGVGGSGFLYEDWWGLPGTGRSTNGVEDIKLYNQMVGCENYWPVINCSTLFLEASNDFNAPFDLVAKAMALQDPAVEQRLAFAPHLNHRTDVESAAARVLWMKSHLTGTFDFPKTSNAELDLTPSDGVPTFKVWPDATTSHTITGVDIYYGLERNSLTRFWRDAQAVDMGTHWEAPCPVFDTDEMMVALAVVHYDMGFSLPMSPGFSPTNLFTVASEVKTIYPPDLASAGVKEVEEKRRLIDDFARGYHDWFQLNADNTEHWQQWTRKVNDASWTGPDTGGELAFDITTSTSGDTVAIKLLVEWNESPANTYVATVPMASVGLNAVSLPRGAFLNVDDNSPLASWDNVVALGVMPGSYVDAGITVWSGAVPSLSNLRWVDGEYAFLNGVGSNWLEFYGLPLNDGAVFSDGDGDGALAWEEFTAATDPTDPMSIFKVSSMQLVGNELELQWPAVAGKSYHLWFSVSLLGGSWSLMEGDLPYTGTMGSKVVVPVGERGFYRIAVE